MNTEDFPYTHPLRPYAELIKCYTASRDGKIILSLKYPWYYRSKSSFACSSYEEAAKRLILARKTQWIAPTPT